MSDDKRELSEEDFRYLRPGHVDLERPCDEMVKYLTELLPGTGVLPKRWSWRSRQYFRDKYGDLGPIVWAKTASYHLLILEGVHALRVWTDSPNSCLVDVPTECTAELKKRGFEILDVPKSTRRKTKPFVYRVRAESKQHIAKIVLVVMKEKL